MKKRNTFKKVAAMTLCVAFAIGGAACDVSLVATDSTEDLKRIVATVDITGDDSFKSDGEFANCASIVKNLNGNVLKRDLVAYFLSAGSTYINDYGWSYRQTFTQLMEDLTSRKIVVQYAAAYYLTEGGDAFNNTFDAYIAAEKAAIKEDAKLTKLIEAHPEVLTLKYFLTENGTDNTDYDKTVYSLKKLINDSLDSAEATYIEEADLVDDETFGVARTTPTGVGTETEDYYDTNYEIYTGQNAADSCGSYERLDGSTQLTRRKAYNDFLSNLSRNGLLKEKEDTSDFTKIDYYYVDLASQLEQALISKFADDLTESTQLDKDYVEEKYAELIGSQKLSYGEKNSTAFETAIGNVSDDSFVVYSPKDGGRFGFVYNILIPFSATATQELSLYPTSDTDTAVQKLHFTKRAELLNSVEAKDLRAAWFSNNDDNNYSYKAATNAKFYKNGKASDYLFFEDNFTNSERYEELSQYLGQYPYNGTIEKDGDKFVSFKPNKMDIDGFITEMEEYIDYALGAGESEDKAVGNPYTGYVDNGNYSLTKGKFDYSQFMYYTGQVSLTQTAKKDFFNKDTDAYKALSAVNELMFAYSTDTGCLNTYMGYVVSPLSDTYVKEFAYAAQYAVDKTLNPNAGVGQYVVCATDYGWHILYVSFVYENGAENVYGAFNYEEKDVEGTFSNLYFESLKSATADEDMNIVQTNILGQYKKSGVKLYKSRYEDLMSIGE
ncbi:MAG: hypothetical protein IJY62_02495 [Clostridia bacterium]|nr:hypothetical protein [Clostridia bacterium]